MISIAPKTRNVFIAAVLLSVVAVSGAAYLLTKIKAEGILLESHIKVITESNQKQEEFTRTQRLVVDTEEERRRVAAAFFKDQSDSLSFLTYVEQELGPSVGVSVKTLNISSATNPTNPQVSAIKMVFAYEGSRQAVVGFSRLLETLPYHSRVESLTISRGADGVIWTGEATVLVTVSSI